MGSWIQRSKETLHQVIDSVKDENQGLVVRIAFVAYRDITDGQRFDVIDFTEDVDKVKSKISAQSAMGGGDFPEDVQGGFNKALQLDWSKESIKTTFHIADAPGHGKDICEYGDSYPNGSPDGFKVQDQMREFAKRGILFTFIKVNEQCNKMIKVMEENYNPSGKTMNVTDLSNACATKSQAEVTKEFVNATSFILSAAVGGKGKGSKKDLAKKVKRTGDPLWDPKKFEVNQYFSQTAYLKVIDIQSDRITVENSYGNQLYVSKDILANMFSASHFSKEVAMNMTGLAELLQSVQDHVFTVSFRKQATEDKAIELLKNADKNALKDQKQLSQLSKDIVSGSNCTLTCHMIEVENNLGRSLVIDLDAKSPSKFRQVDHRTIEHIIFQNVKYVLKKGGKGLDDALAERKKDDPKWDAKQLAVGNWFSGTSYYRAESVSGDNVICKSQDKQIEISKDILEYEMHNSKVFSTEEKMSLTNVATKLTEANNKCFTVCFTTMVNEKRVKEKLEELKGKPGSEAELK